MRQRELATLFDYTYWRIAASSTPRRASRRRVHAAIRDRGRDLHGTLVHTSHQHRAESAELLRHLGRSPGDIDFLDYADSAPSPANSSG